MKSQFPIFTNPTDNVTQTPPHKRASEQTLQGRQMMKRNKLYCCFSMNEWFKKSIKHMFQSNNDPGDHMLQKVSNKKGKKTKSKQPVNSPPKFSVRERASLLESRWLQRQRLLNCSHQNLRSAFLRWIWCKKSLEHWVQFPSFGPRFHIGRSGESQI